MVYIFFFSKIKILFHFVFLFYFAFSFVQLSFSFFPFRFIFQLLLSVASHIPRIFTAFVTLTAVSGRQDPGNVAALVLFTLFMSYDVCICEQSQCMCMIFH